SNGTQLAGFPIRVGGELRGTPAVWDITNTGKTTVVLPCWDKNVYIWDYPGTFIRANAPWPMFRHDDQHTGRYKNPNVITAAGEAEMSAEAGPDGIRVAWTAVGSGQLTWNLYRREDPGSSDGTAPPTSLTAIPTDLVKGNDGAIAGAGGHARFLDP